MLNDVFLLIKIYGSFGLILAACGCLLYVTYTYITKKSDETNELTRLKNYKKLLKEKIANGSRRMYTPPYKGYAGKYYYSEGLKCYIGYISYINKLIRIQGKTEQELNENFKIRLDEYLEVCNANVKNLLPEDWNWEDGTKFEGGTWGDNNVEKVRGFEKISKCQFYKDLEKCGKGVEKILPDCFDILELPQRATDRSAGYDFYSPIDYEILPGQEILVPTGIRSYMLEDEQLKIIPRSSVGNKYDTSLKNTIGLIDADYYDSSNEGHIMLFLKNRDSKKTMHLRFNERFAQGTFEKYLIIDNDCPRESKRDGGMGSTGE